MRLLLVGAECHIQAISYDVNIFQTFNISQQLEHSALQSGIFLDSADQLIASEPPNYAKYIGWGWTDVRQISVS